MKSKKIKLSMTLSVLIISFLISTSYLNTLNVHALVEENYIHSKTDSLDFSTWVWSTTEVVSTDSTAESYRPSLAIDALGSVHIAWYDLTDYAGSGGDFDIFYKLWNATSSTWTSTEVVSTESTEQSAYPSLAIDALGNVHIAWMDLTNYLGAGAHFDIFYKLWNSSTSSWTATEVVSTESTDVSFGPSLAVDILGNVHIAWYDWTDYAGAGIDADIFYKLFNSSSSSWTITEIASIDSTKHSYFPSLAIDLLGNVHLAWADETNLAGAGVDFDIFYKLWNATSTTWTSTEVVSTESTEQSSHPSLALDSSRNVHVAWNDETNYASAGVDFDIFYKLWDSSSSTWTTTEVISTISAGDSSDPSLAVDSIGNIHIAWEDFTVTDRDIFYRHWNSSSSSWSMTVGVSSESTRNSENPSLGVDSNGYVHIVWQDFTDYTGCGTEGDIFYKHTESPPVIPELTYITSSFIEFVILSSFVTFVSMFFVTRIRKKKSKLN